MTLRRNLLLLAAGSLALGALPWLVSDFLLALALTCIMYAGLAVSWAMFCGATNYLSLATAAFFGLGAYVTAWFADVLPYGLAVATGGLVAAGFAALIGAAVLHLRGAYFAVITFGLGELVRHSITYYERLFEGTVGRIITQAPETTTVYWTVLLVAALAVATALGVREHRLGLALRGIGSDEERAQTLGVNARRAKILAFAMSAFFAGALGAAMAVDLHRSAHGVQPVHRLPDGADRHGGRRADHPGADCLGRGVQPAHRVPAAAVPVSFPRDPRAAADPARALPARRHRLAVRARALEEAKCLSRCSPRAA
jgi:branched-chain amino acid transport system permease protein